MRGSSIWLFCYCCSKKRSGKRGFVLINQLLENPDLSEWKSTILDGYVTMMVKDWHGMARSKVGRVKTNRLLKTQEPLALLNSCQQVNGQQPKLPADTLSLSLESETISGIPTRIYGIWVVIHLHGSCYMPKKILFQLFLQNS